MSHPLGQVGSVLTASFATANNAEQGCCSRVTNTVIDFFKNQIPMFFKEANASHPNITKIFIFGVTCLATLLIARHFFAHKVTVESKTPVISEVTTESEPPVISEVTTESEAPVISEVTIESEN